MQKGIKFRIYPNKEQKNLINKIFGCCRLVYNKGLDARKRGYEEGNKINYSRTCKMLTDLKRQPDFEFLNEADSIALQQALRDLDRGYINFFKKRAGYPKFKTKHGIQKYRTLNQNNNIRIVGKYIKLPKLGFVKVKQSMEVGIINNVTVKKTPTGKYFVTLNVDFEPEKRDIKNSRIGIDVGIITFCSFSNGQKIDNPKYLKRSLKKLRKEQKRLSHKKRGSNNYSKQRIKIAKIHETVSDQRNDFLQKLSSKLISENQTICIEDISVKEIITENQKSDACKRKKRNINRCQHDASWSAFVHMLKYKALWYGNTLKTVPKGYPSSQICHCCGYQMPKFDIAVRKWKCPACGKTHDRDFNAAINILNKGLEV